MKKRRKKNQPQRLRLLSVTWHTRVKRCVRLEDRLVSNYGERKHRRPLSYSSRSTLMTHNDRSSSAASSRTHLSSFQRKHQVGMLQCCQVCGLPPKTWCLAPEMRILPGDPLQKTCIIPPGKRIYERTSKHGNYSSSNSVTVHFITGDFNLKII